MLSATLSNRDLRPSVTLASVFPRSTRLPVCPERRIEAAGPGGRRVPDADRRDRPLSGLSGSKQSERFRAWRGRSGRRYIFSVYRLEAGRAPGADAIPTGEEAVVIAVRQQKDGARQVLWIDRTDPDATAFFRSERIQALLARRDCELHLHLLADDAAERRCIVEDLREG